MKNLEIGNIYKLKHNKVFCVSIQHNIKFTDDCYVKVEHYYRPDVYFGHTLNIIGGKNALCEIRFCSDDVWEDRHCFNYNTNKEKCDPPLNKFNYMDFIIN